MTPQEKMLLHYFAVYTDTAGEIVVGRIDVAALLDVSTPTATKRLENVIKIGYVNAIKQPFAIGRGNGYKWVYHITKRGQAAWKIHENEASELYHSHKSDRLLAALKQARTISKKHGKKIKRADNQLDMFGELR